MIPITATSRQALHRTSQSIISRCIQPPTFRVSSSSTPPTPTTTLTPQSPPKDTASAITHSQESKAPIDTTPPATESQPSQKEEDDSKKPLTTAEKDAQMRQALEGISGEGGEAGLELEDGQPVAMKRGVKNNMFRVI